MKKFVIVKIGQNLIEEIIHEALFDKISAFFPNACCEQYAEILQFSKEHEIIAVGVGVAVDCMQSELKLNLFNELNDEEDLQKLIAEKLDKENFIFAKIDLKTMLSYIENHLERTEIENFPKGKRIISNQFFGEYNKDLRCVAVISLKNTKESLCLEDADKISDYSIGDYNKIKPSIIKITKV